MLDVDEDSAYTYEKYVDGHLAKTGKGWLKNLEHDFEKEAWRKAVKEYKKTHGIYFSHCCFAWCTKNYHFGSRLNICVTILGTIALPTWHHTCP